MNQENNIDINFESLEKSDQDLHTPGGKRKNKPRDNKNIIVGVCRAIGEKFNIDPFYIRLALIFSVFIGIWGVAGYLAAAIILTKTNFFKTEDPSGRSRINLFRITAVILLAIILLLLFYISDLFEFFFQPIIFGFSKDFPAELVA